MRLRQLLKENRFFLIPYAIIFATGLILLLVYSKAELHIASNQLNSPFFDWFFRYATNLGDGMMIPLICIALLFVKYRFALAFLAGSLATSLIITLIKKVLIHEAYRPSKYFELYENYQLHFVEGVKLHSLHSFPSGHTGTAFNVFFVLAIITKNQWLKFIFLLSACLAAYSRIYLSQHFLIDVVAGSFIGTIMILISFYGFQKLNGTWPEKSIIIKR